MWLYHSTFRANLKSIKELGLGAKQPKNWDFSLDGEVCLCSDSDAAFSFCEVAEDISDSKYNSGIVVLAVDSEVLDWRLVVKDQNIREEKPMCTFIAYRGIIPSNQLYVATIKGSKFRILGKLLDLKRVPSYE